MSWNIVHLAPFDIGKSFNGNNDSDLHQKEVFSSTLKQFILDQKYELLQTNISNCFLAIKLNNSISCYLLDYGIGVFVIKNINSVDLTEVRKVFEKDIPYAIYYSKQHEQHMILNHQLLDSKLIKQLMQKIWSLITKKERIISSNNQYKKEGFSYIFSLYHIISNCYKLENDKSFDMLMNPTIINKIYNQEQWNSIISKIQMYNIHGFHNNEFNNSSNITSSWAAVAVVEEKESESLTRILDYEIELQASWFLFDCLIENINKTNMTNLQLQKQKSLATNISLNISTILTPNMSLSEKNTFESIYETSGFKIIQDKLFLLLENKIAIAIAKLNEKQSRYAIITEIFLVLFTLVSIYEPLRNLINGEIKTSDIILATIMLILFVICSYFIVRKKQ
ncbi:hypothetical protein JM47_01970 [Ureaplasma diversum]|uniref:Uncharacterized protein n=1 Tax=Ureaplasma diversum TaxID=42094 RepID=A0A0C5RBX5_9BACT|nr:hypothetical protein [Ureaplasma diversum]AJQ45356.1 hypothetical protein JM47_01970 [Ureaplasma diversum]